MNPSMEETTLLGDEKQTRGSYKSYRGEMVKTPPNNKVLN